MCIYTLVETFMLDMQLLYRFVERQRNFCAGNYVNDVIIVFASQQGTMTHEHEVKMNKKKKKTNKIPYRYKKKGVGSYYFFSRLFFPRGDTHVPRTSFMNNGKKKEEKFPYCDQF